MDLTASLRVVYPSLTLSKRFSHRCGTIWTATAVRKRNQWRAAAIRLYCLDTSGIRLLCAAGAIDGTLQLINLLWRAGLKFAMHASVAWSAQADVTVRLPDAPSRVLARMGDAAVHYHLHRHLQHALLSSMPMVSQGR